MHWSQPGPDRTTALLREAGFTVEDTYAVPDTLAEDDDVEDLDASDDVGEKVFVWATA
jgi:hypothetical protein